MRKIKFRAWDSKLKKWIPGADEFHILGEAMLLGGLFQDYLVPDIMRLNDIVISQFTGLLDKNGKEIYEGDIIRNGWSNEEDLGVVEFADGIFNLNIGYCETLKTQAEDSEVIGNIYENPELIGGRKK